MRYLTAVICSLIFNSATTSLAHLNKRGVEAEPIYYDCGSGILSESFIKHLISDQDQFFEQELLPFWGLLYHQSLNYQILRLPDKYCPPASHDKVRYRYSRIFIVFNKERRIIDLITEMKNGHYIKCKRTHSSSPDTSLTSPSEKPVYQCGHEIFSYQDLEQSVNEAKSKLEKNKIHGRLYKGNLYKQELGYWIYPVLREENKYALTTQKSTYYVVINQAGELVDVIAELISKDFIRCMKMSRKPETATEENLRFGYSCGAQFFDAEQLNDSALIARQHHMNPSKTFPRAFSGPPLNTETWIYPLMFNGAIYGGGSFRIKNFVVMDLSFNIITVIRKTKDGMKTCEASMRGLETVSPEDDDFVCDGIIFDIKHILASVSAACSSARKPDRKFPAQYVGPAFKVPGPYLTWPLIKGKIYKNATPGNFRAVMNTQCEFSGIIARRNRKSSHFYKCRRKKDHSIPGEDSLMEIVENFRF